MSLVPYKEFVNIALSQQGDQYIFGVEVSPSDTNPSAFDCSELVEWASYRIDINPKMPDGSWWQYQHCYRHGLVVGLGEAILTPGALLFRFGGDPMGRVRPPSAHVAISLGDHRTIEARGRAYGVGIFSAYGRGWTHAALVPGLDYTNQQGDLEMSLQSGDRGNAVKKLQRALNEFIRLYRKGEETLTVDGAYGPVTEDAVADYQKAADLPQTGITDGITMALLMEYQVDTVDPKKGIPPHRHAQPPTGGVLT